MFINIETNILINIGIIIDIDIYIDDNKITGIK